jgi:nucleoside-diphosphate-sugar epimerase
LIIACGCRGRLLARELTARGHAVRATTRSPDHRPEIVAAGAEAVIGDPDRVATLWPALEHVAVAYILLGSAAGGPEELATLHGSRLEMLLHKMLDTTVRGIVYEARGRVDPAVLLAGAERVRRFCEGSLIPYELLEADPDDHGAWVAAAAGAGDRVLQRE